VYISEKVEFMILEAIKTRRAVFPIQFSEEPISEEEIRTLLEAANWAPTHRRTEPWRFKIFHSEASRKALSKFLGATYFETAVNFSETKQKKIIEKPLQSGCVLAICMRRDPKASVPEWEEIASTAMAVQNIWLATGLFNIGGYWSTPDLRHHLHKHIELAPGEKCLGFFYLGKYKGELSPGMRNSSITEKISWI
jgi:nitroreductase